MTDALNTEFVKHVLKYRPKSVTARLATELKWQRRLADKLQANYDELYIEVLALEGERNELEKERNKLKRSKK